MAVPAANRAERLALIALVLYALLLFNLFRMQVLKGAYYHELSEKNRIRVVFLEGTRGKLLDRKGRALATSRLSFNCSAVPWELKKGDVRRTSEILSRILGESAETLEKRFKDRRKAGAFNTVILAEDIGAEKAVRIEELLDTLPGIIIETRPQRVYPYGDAAAHLTGYIGPMNQTEKDELEVYGYRERDWLGRDGLERSYESTLHGTSGGLQIEVNSRGKLLRALGVREPRDGKDVRLSVDAELQKFVQQQLEGTKGAVVVIDLADGGILSVNSSPSFDPNLFATAKGRRDVGKYLKDELAPMLDRAIHGGHPPGSIYKIVTALAALQKGRMTPHSTIYCPGQAVIGGIRFGCWKETGHGSQDLRQAMAHSCNVYFYNAGLAAGADAIHALSLDLGMSKPTGVDLPNEKSGFVPSRAWKRSARGTGWFDGETANLSIGQGYLQVTPIQAALMVSAVALDGRLPRPHLVKEIDGQKAYEPSFKALKIDPAVLRAVKEGMDAVVNTDTGTGRLSRAEGTRVAGKTGTAQSGKDRTHAWFVGYAPSDKPRAAMVVFLEHGGRGGVSAAKIASQVFGWLVKEGYA
ncbi:MAG: Peptidoglycan D,D-transpeptidase MrdA [Candidatus Omnitrophica bacterium]|nr:Peptidoglycan D,D-transpeptidase MrdA [Candidatus Omnitrophota bacterium]